MHWIMLTGTEKDTHDITAMDPIDGFVHMSDYDNRIYGVRVVTGSVETLETNGASWPLSRTRPLSGILKRRGLIAGLNCALRHFRFLDILRTFYKHSTQSLLTWS